MKAPPLFAALLACGLSISAAQAQDAPTPLLSECGAGARDSAMMLLKQMSSSPEADLAAANTAIAASARLKADTLAGLDVPGPYRAASRYAQQAAKAASPEAAELLRRAANDVLARIQVGIAMHRTEWAAGLSEPALVYAFRIRALDACGLDDANTAWLKAQLKTRDWFTIDAYGPDADRAAFLLVQHADNDVAFQEEILPRLEKLALERKTEPKQYAMLFDRVAYWNGRPQRYGSQGRCTAAGVWTPFKIEDPAHLDQRRAAMGLPPSADYIAGISARSCKAG